MSTLLKFTLLASGSWWWEAENLLNILSYRHGTQDVKKDEGTFSEVASLKISMWQTLDPRDRRKRKAGDDFSIKNWVEHWEKSSESETGEEPDVVKKLCVLILWGLLHYL